MDGIECVLLDIGNCMPDLIRKGHTGKAEDISLSHNGNKSFVVAFPYALKALPDVVTNKWTDPEFISYRDAFPAEHRSSPEALQAHVEDLTKRDVKVAYLKNLQGYLWEEGYKTGAYATPLFPDVEPQFNEWKQLGLKIVIYSSGSVFAQKLLFGHVDKPQARPSDLTSSISGWYDTVNAGLKSEPSSYDHIAKDLKIDPSGIMFFSDNVKEVRAAIAAGMLSVVVDRPGNAPLSDADRQDLKIVESLHDISLSPARIDARFWKK